MDHDAVASHTTFKSYVIGLILSLVLTLGAYFLVSEQLLTSNALVFTISGAAFVQAVVQLYFFLHLGQEKKPHWNALVFSFMVLVLAIVVVGSLWIMYHLNYNMTPTIDVKTFLKQQRGL